MMNKNFIIPFHFNLLDSNFDIWKYRLNKKDDCLVVLRKLDYTKNTELIDVGRASAQVVTMLDGNHFYWKTYHQAKDEFERTGKVEGFEILNLMTFDKLWISNYDIKVLNKLTTN